MLIVATGDGKGKTTAAVGQAIRALGHGKRVFFAQFVKSDSFPSGEDVILRSFGDRLVYLKGGKGFVGICGDTLPFAEHKAAAEQTLAAAESALTSGKYDLVVLDEVNVAIALKLITRKDLFAFLKLAPEGCDIVCTGRHADPEVLRRADFVTECVEVKHPFHKKVAAKKGIDY